MSDSVAGELSPAQLEAIETLRDPGLEALTRWTGIVAAEPAMAKLPVAERWRPRTLAHFRSALLKHLESEGAHSMRELEANPPEVLGLPLRADELTVVVESARRHGLVARLDPHAGSGSIWSRDEWVVTEAGRRITRRGAAWLLPHLGRISATALTVLAAILTVLGTKLTVNGRFWSVFPFVMVALALAALGALLSAWYRARRSGTGAAKDAVARDWSRWVVAFPDLYEKATKPFPRRWLFASLLAIALGATAPAWVPGGDVWSEAVLYLGVLGGWFLFLLTVGNWLMRWTAIQGELHRRRVVSFLHGDD